jgi:ketosteroid isomerase-like protein
MSDGSTTPDSLEVLRRQREALTRRDFDAVRATYTADAVIDASPVGGVVFEGRDAILDFFEDWIGAYEEYELEGEDFRDFGNGVTFGVVASRARPAGTNGRVETRFASVVRWAGGLIERTTFYSDADEARAAAERLAGERE